MNSGAPEEQVGQYMKGDPISRFTPPVFCVIPIQDLYFQYVVVFFVFNSLMWEMIVGFIDNDEIVDHHYFNILFIISINTQMLAMIKRRK